jgi:hypothetical protein
MLKSFKFFSVLVVATALTGCISYTGVVTPGDELVDESNAPFAKSAADTFAQRQKFRRQVVIQEAEGVNLFLSPQFVARSNNHRANALCRNIEVRRTMLQSAKARLREMVSSLKDLQLTGDASAPMVSVTADDNAVPSVYRITYNISNLDLQLRESSGLGNFVRSASSKENKIYYSWIANVTVEVRMIAPDGSNVFTFNSVGTLSQDDDGSLNPNPTMLEQASINAITGAMKQYAYKFGPPIYVTETCQNGEFACLSVGADYGLREGMKVEFFRHRQKKGLDGNVEMTEMRVGTGTVGQGKAPVESAKAWVHVDNYDSEARTVFQWTSAKLIKGEGGTSGIGALGFEL